MEVRPSPSKTKAPRVYAVPALLDFANRLRCLHRYRFLAELSPEPDERALADRENLIYECLPGLYLYDVRRLARPAIDEALAKAAVTDEPGPDGEAAAEELEP